MDTNHNVFISHYGADDHHLQRLKERFTDLGRTIRNSSIDSTKYRPYVPSNATIERYLRRGIGWAGTFILLIGPQTHTRPWVDFEIKEAIRQGKRIVGIYTHGSNGVQLPEAFEKYGGPAIGWNSLDKLGDALDGKPLPTEKPDGTPRAPIYIITRVKCKR